MNAPDQQLSVEIHAAALDMLTGLGSFERAHHRSGGGVFPDDVWAGAAEAGWFAMLVPESLDGLGLGFVELASIFRAAGRRLVRGPLYDHAVAVPLIAASASPSTVPRLLEAAAGDKTIVLACAPEPPFGDGLAAVTLTPEGLLSGTVDLVAFAEHADRLVVAGTRAGEPVIVLVETSGARVESMESHDPCVEYGRVVFDNVVVDGDDIVAAGPAAAELLSRTRAACRLMAAVEVSAAADELTTMSVEYALSREQFGRPIGGFQALRHMLATMKGRATSLRSLCDACAHDADADPPRLVEIGATAKAYSARVGRYIAEESLQIHGGVGFTWEHPLHLHLRRILTLQGFLGEAEEIHVELGRALLEADGPEPHTGHA